MTAMHETTRDGVGLVATTSATLFEETPLTLDCGRTIDRVTVAWEQYGTLDDSRSNAVLVCHALSGGAHAAGWHEDARKPGWWHGLIGPGRAFDTTRYCVICSNVLGSCYGTTGPASVDPATGRPYGPRFPFVTLWDMVRVQGALIEHLGIPSLAAVAGGSMGGMQALAWAVLYPQVVRSVIAIASTDRHSPQQIAFNEVARRAVIADPAWRGGEYEAGAGPAAGLAVARMLGHITYLCDARLERQFGRRARAGLGYAIDRPEFEVERYLAHQGESFVGRFDANSLLYLTRAIDYFDLAELDGSLEATVRRAEARFLFLTFASDWLYPPAQLERLAGVLRAAGRRVDFECLPAEDGHDSFLIDDGRQAERIRSFLEAGGALQSDRSHGAGGAFACRRACGHAPVIAAADR
jgi:homoserine O-acetyltransferase/O-succinyltransferase